MGHISLIRLYSIIQDPQTKVPTTPIEGTDEKRALLAHPNDVSIALREGYPCLDLLRKDILFINHDLSHLPSSIQKVLQDFVDAMPHEFT